MVSSPRDCRYSIYKYKRALLLGATCFGIIYCMRTDYVLCMQGLYSVQV